MSFRSTYNLFRIHISYNITKVRNQGLKCISCPRASTLFENESRLRGDQSKLSFPACGITHLPKSTWMIEKRSYHVEDSQQALEEEQAGKLNSIDRAFDFINVYLKKTGRVNRRSIERALFHIAKSDHPQTSFYLLLLIRCCGNKLCEEIPETRQEIIKAVWEYLVKSGTNIGLQHYNALIQVYNDNGYKFSPDDILKEMSENTSIRPNYDTFNKLIYRYSEDGDIEGANSILELMKEKEIAIGKDTFDALVLAHSNSGDMKSVQETMDMMGSNNYIADRSTYFYAVRGLAKCGNGEKLMEMIKECSGKGMVLYDNELIEIIQILAVNKHVNLISPIINELRRGVGYQRECICGIISLVSYNCPEAGYLLLNTLLVSPSITERKTGMGIFFIKQLISIGIDAEKLAFYCEKLVTTAMHPYAFEIAVKILIQNSNDNVERALMLLQGMNAKGREMRPHYFWPLLASANATADKPMFFKVLKAMNDLHVLNVYTMQKFALEFMLPVTDDKLLIEELKEAEIELPMIVSGFVQHYLGNKNPEKAAELCAHYKVPIHVFSQRNLSVNLCEKHCHEEAVTIMLHMLDQSYYRERRNSGTVQDFDVLKAILIYVRSMNEDHSSRATHLMGLFTSMKNQRVGLPDNTIDELYMVMGASTIRELHKFMLDMMNTSNNNNNAPVSQEKEPVSQETAS